MTSLNPVSWPAVLILSLPVFILLSFARRLKLEAMS